MDAQQRALISAIHSSGRRCVLTATGGGVGAIAWLLSVPGGSRTILEALVPYDERSLEEFLGRAPVSCCSADTALLMARRAFERARWLAPGQPVAGIACTASLRSDRPKRGDHRCHLAIQASQQTWTYSLTLAKDVREREEEEVLVDLLILNALADAFHLAGRLDMPLLPGETIRRETQPSGDLLSALCEGQVRAVFVDADGRLSPDGPRPLLLVPGSFNPLHTGHCTLAEVAGRRTGMPAAFELSLVNADKPPLSVEQVRQRLAFFAGKGPLWLTRAPTFVEKAELFPGVVFVVGVDTAERIVHPRFYGDSAAQLDRAMTELRSRKCRFLVAGRRNAEGNFIDLSNAEIPEHYRDLFAEIPAIEFRVDLCSTQLRSGN